jgi:hypothetical protein
MLKEIVASLHVSKIESLANSFRRLGLLGFWLQVVLGSIPVMLMFYVSVFSGSLFGPRAGLPVVEYLTILNLAVLAFTTYWFFRYSRFSKTLLNPADRPTESGLVATVWTGVVASSLGILFSMLVMLLEVGQLLFYFLSAPQAGVPAIQTTGSGGASWVSAVDLVSLMSLLLTLAAEVVALVIGLWLLFRTSQTADELSAPGSR